VASGAAGGMGDSHERGHYMSSRTILFLFVLLAVPGFVASAAADDTAAIGPQPKGTIVTEAFTNACWSELTSHNLLDANVHCFRLSVLWYDYTGAHAVSAGSESPFRGWGLEATQPITNPPTSAYGWYYFYVDDNSIVDRGNSIILDPSQVTISPDGRLLTAHVLGATLTWQATTAADTATDEDIVEDIKITDAINGVARKWSVRYGEHRAAVGGRIFVIADPSRWVDLPGDRPVVGILLRRWVY
jgi:hypothetical protein